MSNQIGPEFIHALDYDLKQGKITEKEYYQAIKDELNKPSFLKPGPPLPPPDREVHISGASRRKK